MKQILSFVNLNWLLVTQFSLSIISVIASGLIKPEFLIYDSDSIFRITQIIASFLILLLFLPLYIYKKHRHFKMWWALSFLIFINFCIAIGVYTNNIQKFTLESQGKLIVIGELNNMKKEAIQQKNKLETRFGRTFSAKECVISNGGNADQLWDSDYLRSKLLSIILQYVMILFSGVIFILLIMQSIKCQISKS